ncbi:MAG TPA: PPC domain-containing DNA-binding protein [Rudaea sp.]|jgi:hypothetical protein|nr:PPC domain-containing DNA-binding protein [Rudaea sp.]
MKSKLMTQDNGMKIHIVVLDPDEEAFGAIGEFARRENISAASISAVGAFKRATVGWFDFDTKKYRPIEVDEQCEVLSVLGDIAIDDKGEPSVHVHAVFGLKDGSTRGGHLLKAIVNPTLELTITETPAELHRTSRPELGIALIDLSK